MWVGASEQAEASRLLKGHLMLDLLERARQAAMFEDHRQHEHVDQLPPRRSSIGAETRTKAKGMGSGSRTTQSAAFRSSTQLEMQGQFVRSNVLTAASQRRTE